MKITGITIAGFGGVSGEVNIDLNADVVIVVGANGYGKTTICNAISWAISGRSSSTQGPRNLYSRSGTTTVELQTDFDGDDVLITRSLENPDETDSRKLRAPLRVRIQNETLRGGDAELWLRRNLAGSDTNEDFDTLAQSFVDSIYLKQESLREFLTGRQDTERFEAVASMVGAGRIREFADELQSHKRAWVRAVNMANSALDGDRAKLEDLSTSLSALETEITRANAAEVTARWRKWRDAVTTFGLLAANEVEGWELSEQSLIRLRAVLNQERSAVEQDEVSLLATRAELNVPLPEGPADSDLDRLEDQVANLGSQKTAIEREVLTLRVAVEQADAALRQAGSIREDLANMATILLRHVADNCAACGQEVDQDVYRRRLESLANETEDRTLREVADLQRKRLESLEALLSTLSLQLATASDRHRTALEQRASALAAKDYRERRLNEVLTTHQDDQQDLEGEQDHGIKRIDLELDRIASRKSQITQTLESGRQFDAAASLGSSKARRDRLEIESEALRDSLASSEQDIAARRHTNEVATELLEAVKADAETFVASRLTQLEPLLRQFYAAIDPHPTFRSVEIATRQFGGKHRLTPVLRDDELRVNVPEPGETLSTSQANALAVSLFLSFNLGFAPTHVKSLILDDPLQNLDDVHLLGLVDLLRKILPHRQLIVTTHDHAFASLLARKLRPVSEDFRTTYIRFTKWDRNGPGVEQWDVPAETNPMKLVPQ
ncbi:AAA family ATPase [Rhodococcus sp. 077-4]|uniref:ATP-binding protein n=1 Tax=Rhodococcus sp. 077-4 TaxID=2789271 RepID=UPI0039F572CF